MQARIKKQIIARTSNERGVTLVEVLAVLVLTVMVTGLLTYVFNFANSSLRQVAERETVLQQSRDIIQHLTGSVRLSGLMPAGLEPGDTAPRSMPPSSRLYLTNHDGTESIDYRWNSSDQTLTVEHLIDGNPVIRHTFSDKVLQLSIQAEQQHMRGPIRYIVTLEIQLPNLQTRKTVTTILSSDRN